MSQQMYVMQNERVGKAIYTLALPAILSSLVGVIYNIIDTYYISLLHNESMIAATTVALVLNMIIQAFGDGISVGASGWIGRLNGQGKFSESYVALCTAMTLCFVIGLVASLVMVINLKQILQLFSIEQDVITYAYDYMFIILSGGLILVLKQALSGILRSNGIVKWPTISIIVGIIINIILDPIFMFDYGLNMTIKGAAYATVLSQTVSVLMMLWKLCSKTNDFKWRFLDFSFDMESIKQIGSIGIAAFTRQILPSFSITFLIRSASVYGTAMVAAMGISKKALRIITGVFAGYSHGMQPFFSFNYGARNSKRIVRALSISRSFVICIGVATSIVFWFYGEKIALLFGNNINTVQYCGNMMKGYALSIPVLGIYHVYASALQAFGKKKASMILSSTRQGLFYIPIVIILPRYFCQSGLYLSQPLSDWLTFALLIYLCRNISKEIFEL